MRKLLTLIVCPLALFLVPAAFAGVKVTRPKDNSTVSGAVNYVASATTNTCSKGVASMGIYTAPGVLVYVVNGDKMNTSLDLSPGTYNTVVEEWDNCGGAETKAINITVTSGGKSGVSVSAPANNSTVGSPVNFVATATSSCPQGVSSMGIYTAPGVLAYVVQGASMNYNLSLSPGTYNTVVEEWDKCNGAATTPITITVKGGGGNSFYNLQSEGGWDVAGQGPPNYVDCNPCGSQISWSSKTNISSPSMDGNATKYSIGGDTPYWDVLWDNPMIGVNSTQGLPDPNQTLVPSLHDFTYDVYFYGSNLNLSQALEFDINQFYDNLGFIWGHECRIAGGNEWDVWDNVSAHWVPTGIACYPNENQWNHLTIQVERTSSNQLLYKSITLNGDTHTLNWTYNPGSTDGWYGITINWQMDGNYQQSPYSVYLDELTFTYE
jgi:hypothetical protein